MAMPIDISLPQPRSASCWLAHLLRPSSRPVRSKAEKQEEVPKDDDLSTTASGLTSHSSIGSDSSTTSESELGSSHPFDNSEASSTGRTDVSGGPSSVAITLREKRRIIQSAQRNGPELAALVTELIGSDTTSRYHAAESLGARGHLGFAAAPALQFALLTDENLYVRKSAAWALGQVADANVPEALLDLRCSLQHAMAHDKNNFVCEEAENSLRALNSLYKTMKHISL